MRILLADDHAIVRSGLRRIIEDEFAGVTIGEASNADEVIRKSIETQWNAMILDISMGDRSGLDLIPELRQRQPKIPIIILSMYSDRQFVIRALHSGVSGYVTKDRAPEELLKAIRTVLAGKRYVCESVASQIAEHIASADDESIVPHDRLSAREYEVFLLLASALSVTQIAEQLRLSVKTISTYRTRILEKLGLSSNAQLIRYALENKLIK